MALQNRMADERILPRYSNWSEVEDAAVRRALEDIPQAGRGYVLVGGSIPYLLPQARLFLFGLSADFHKAFGAELRITSLVRTSRHQRLLERLGISDARDSDDDQRSVHTTGAAFDISRRTLTQSHLAWLRKRLVDLEREKKIEATEEICSNAFHIMVFPPAPEIKDSMKKDKK